MSAHKVRAKRALPNVPGRLRAETAVDRSCIRAAEKANGSDINPALTSKVYKRGKSVPEICLKSASCVSNSNVNHGSPLGTRKPVVSCRIPTNTFSRSKENMFQDCSEASTRTTPLLPESSAFPVKAEDIFPCYSNTEKKVARVLPMTPAFLEDDIGTLSPEFELITKQSGFCVANDGLERIEDGGFMMDEGSDTKSAESKKWGKPFEVFTFNEEASSVRVAVRLRPFTQRDKEDPEVINCITMKGHETIITSPATNAIHEFYYDYSLDSSDPKHSEFADQEKVYNLMGEPLLISAFQGFNTCLFAYGQTGSGKSYSIMGQGDELGVLPRFCCELFERIAVWSELQFTVEISFFEIYNEKIHDLLASSKGKDGKKVQLKVREHPVQGPFVQDLSTYVVTSFEDVESWLAVGNRNRATAATGMNDKSSRSHSVFTILMTQTKTEIFEGTEAQMTKTSKINLIDLAGSERANKVLNDQVIDSAETAALRLKEGGSINKSLHTLGKVISILSDRDPDQKKKPVYIPYRDSVLTWLLKDSLGGNSKTAMIATISPASNHFAETLSTLRYAHRARTIVNKAMINEDPNAKLIRELRAEIERLKSTPSGMTPVVHRAAVTEILHLREKLGLSQKLLTESTRKWQEKLALTERRKLEEAEKLKKAGISFKVDNKLPSLVNLNEDPQLSEMLLYILKEGESTVGRGNHDIQLSGALVAESHCVIKNEEGQITLVPLGDGQTYVNGQLIAEDTALHHGDRVVVGGDHFFRLNNAIEVDKRRTEQHHEGVVSDGVVVDGVVVDGVVVDGVSTEAVVIKDFEFARNELAQVQNARLQAELEEAREEARIKAQEELMTEMQVEKEAVHHKMMEQKNDYDKRVEELQGALESVSSQKQQAEQTSQSAEEQISQLQAHRMVLEQEILNNRQKLQMEAIAAKQALEETKMNQVRIVSELEKAKKKMQEDVLKLKEAKKNREKMREEFRASFSARRASLSDDPTKKELLRITMGLREANKISQGLRKSLTFSRDDVMSDGKSEVKIRVNDTKKGLTTLWNLEKFDSKLAQMRELYQQQEDDDSVSGEDCDPFASDSEDKWEKDFKIDSPAHGRKVSRSRTGANTSPRKTSASVSKAESIFAKYRNPRTDNDAVEESGNTSEGLESSAAANAVEPPRKISWNKSNGPVIRTAVTSSLSSSRRSSAVSFPVSSLCSEFLAKSLQSLEEYSKEPLHDVVLRSAHNLKKAVLALKTSAQEGQGFSQDTQALCFQATVAMTSMLEQSRMWYLGNLRSGDRGELEKEMTVAIKELLGQVVTITRNLDKDWDTWRKEVFASFEDSLKRVVKLTARFAVLSLDDTSSDGQIQDDEDLNLAFVKGQNLSLEMSFRRSLRSIDNIQENLQVDVIHPHAKEVEKELSQNVLVLLKATSDFLHQGHDLQTALLSRSKHLKNDSIHKGKLLFTRKCIANMDTLLETTRALVSGSRQACETMDARNLMKFLEEISGCSECATRQYRNFIESDHEALARDSTSSLMDEMEYFEEKAQDVRTVSEDMKEMLKASLVDPSI